MTSEQRGEVTELLRDIARGDQNAMDHLCEIAYADMRWAAQHLMGQERTGHTLQPTALVNEALLRLFGSDLFAAPGNRAIFFSAVTRAMRRVLVDHARRRNAAKRGGHWRRTAWDDVVQSFETEGVDLERLDAGLMKLQGLHQRQYEIVQLRFFGGLPIAQIAELLSLSQSAVEKDLQKARGFLFGELSDG